MTLAIDGSATINNSGGSSSQSINLTTTKVGDLIILLVQQTGSVQSTITDSIGLTWTLRGSIQDGSTSATRYEEWYAVWSGSGTITITVTITTSAVIVITAFGVTGYDTSKIFDSGASVFPLTTTSPAQQNSFSGSYSTNDANTLAFVFYGGNFVGAGNQQTINTDAGYTTIQSDLEGNGFSTLAEYIVNTSPVSAAPLTASDSTLNAWYTILVDAIRAAVPAPPPTPPSVVTPPKAVIPSKITPPVTVPIYNAKQLIGSQRISNIQQPNIETPTTAVGKIFKDGRYIKQ